MQKIIMKKIAIALHALLLLTANAVPVFAAEAGKALCFEERNGSLVWNSVQEADGNRFMSFTNMVPGEIYEDKLSLQNNSVKTYMLYLQAMPYQQSEKADELLELIHMKVFLDEEVLYRGSASGQAYQNGDLQKVIYLGTYQPKDTSAIRVELMLDKAVGMEYCELFTEIEWRFMAAEISHPGELRLIRSPKTGEDTPAALYAAIMGCSFLSVALIAGRKSGKRR